MRRTIVLSLVAAACLSGAAWYLSGEASGQLWQRLTGGSVELSDGKQAKGSGDRVVAVVTAVATSADFPIRRHAIGFVISPAVVEISARVSSQIVQIDVKDGQMVRAGDLLFRLDDRSLKAAVDRDQAMLDKDQALLVSAKADSGRAKDLAAKQAGTQQAYDQALAAEKAAEATVASDQATLDADQVQLGYATITAPIAGRLGVVNVAVGDLVAPVSAGGTAPAALVTITQIDPLEASFTLPEGDLPLLQKAMASPSPPAVTLYRGGDSQPIGKGVLDFIDSSVDTASGTIAVRANVPNPQQTLWPGQYINVVLDAGTMPGLTSVPTVAVQSGQKGPFVFVVGADSKVAVRQVTVALNEGQASAISDGLKAGERVVVEGQTRLADGTLVREGKPADGRQAASTAATDKAAEAGRS
jgi:membrane fusion protein, multidrug efflux system